MAIKFRTNPTPAAGPVKTEKKTVIKETVTETDNTVDTTDADLFEPAAPASATRKRKTK